MAGGTGGCPAPRCSMLSMPPWSKKVETRLSYAALGDLLEPVQQALPAAPEPQRRALEVALLRSPSSGARADQWLVLLGLLQDASGQKPQPPPVVLAIDDVQRMASSFSRVLQFVVRRLKDEQVGSITAVEAPRPDDHPGRRVGLRQELRARRPRRPVSQDALERVLRAKGGRRVLRMNVLIFHQMSGGNPFFARE